MLGTRLIGWVLLAAPLALLGGCTGDMTLGTGAAGGGGASSGNGPSSGNGAAGGNGGAGGECGGAACGTTCNSTAAAPQSFVCDGAGQCVEESTVMCSEECAGAACGTMCNSTAAAPQPYICNGTGQCLLAANVQCGAGGAGGGGAAGAGGSGGGGEPIDCTDDPGVCPTGYGCACGGPGGQLVCQCGLTCVTEKDCTDAAQPVCCPGGSPDTGICTDACTCFCD
jgi:hypothetical protein